MGSSDSHVRDSIDNDSDPAAQAHTLRKTLLREYTNQFALAGLILHYNLQHHDCPRERDRITTNSDSEYDPDSWQHVLVAPRLVLHVVVLVSSLGASKLAE